MRRKTEMREEINMRRKMIREYKEENEDDEGV